MHWDPFTGLGMDCAASHAAALAEELLAAHAEEALLRYHRRRDQALETLQEVSALAGDLRQLASA